MANESTESAPQQTSAGNDGTGNGAPEPKSVKELPDWAQSLISETRQEAADYRTRLRSAKDEARSEIQAEFESKIKEYEDTLADFKHQLSDKDLNYAKLEVALGSGLGGERAVAFATRLRGTTVDELKADAQEALKIFGTSETNRATDPSQGLGSEPPKTPDQVMGDFFTQRLKR